MNEKLSLVADTISSGFRDVVNLDTIDCVKNYSESYMQRIRVFFKNGYSLSIIQGKYSYGGEQGLFEIAPFNKRGKMDGELLGNSESDVFGYLSIKQVQLFIKQIGELK